jgi:hypothetical protein
MHLLRRGSAWQTKEFEKIAKTKTKIDGWITIVELGVSVVDGADIQDRLIITSLTS